DTFAAQGVPTGTLSNAHSVAVDPISNVAYVPTSSAATSRLCSSKGVADANGCILVYSQFPQQAPLTCAFSTRMGDLNGDGRADILFRRQDGTLNVFLMNGFQLLGSQNVAFVGLEWRVAGVADFNGNGTADILLRRVSDGTLTMLLMNGFSVLSSGSAGNIGL